ncbi:MAG: amidohydrolase family protein [Candidatus Limnocylindrales bacterium]
MTIDQPARLVIRDVALIDATGREPEGRVDVLVEAGRIARIGDVGRIGADVVAVDGAGTTLLPGLTDAHVHFALIGVKGDHGSDPWIVHVLDVSRVIEDALQEGFTTVRDAGGLEPAWAQAVAGGSLRGPRILPAGSPLSQTGGHADIRQRHEHVQRGPTIPGLVAGMEVVDGVDEVVRAAREQLRRGATQIKLMASGGLISPTDPLHSLQLSVAEIAAVVEVARSWGTYVMAHCHTTPSVEMALDAGVRSIEHGSILEPETAARIAAEGAFMVPTLQTMESFMAHPERMGLAPEKVALLDDFARQAYRSVQVARDAGVKLASGSDVVGPWQGRRGEELMFKARVLGAHEAIISATRVNAELFMLEDEIGTVEVGKRADLVLVKGQPLDDIALMAEPDNVVMVLRDGRMAKDSEDRVA